MICKYCGKNLEEGSLFCNSCGQSTTNVTNANQYVQQNPAQQCGVQQYGVQQYGGQQYGGKQYGSQKYNPMQNIYQYGNRSMQSKNNDMLGLIIGMLFIIGIILFVFLGESSGISIPWHEF